MKVKAGDKVSQGQLLALLDDTAQKARVQQAKESLRASQASLGLAQIQVDRLTAMRESNVASKF